MSMPKLKPKPAWGNFLREAGKANGETRDGLAPSRNEGDPSKRKSWVRGKLGFAGSHNLPAASTTTEGEASNGGRRSSKKWKDIGSPPGENVRAKIEALRATPVGSGHSGLTRTQSLQTTPRGRQRELPAMAPPSPESSPDSSPPPHRRRRSLSVSSSRGPSLPSSRQIVERSDMRQPQRHASPSRKTLSADPMSLAHRGGGEGERRSGTRQEGSDLIRGDSSPSPPSSLSGSEKFLRIGPSTNGRATSERISRRKTLGPLSHLAPTGALMVDVQQTTGSAGIEEPRSPRLPDNGPMASPKKKKKTFMEKVGDILEAAAETAIPQSPGNNRRRRRRPRTRGWEDWEVVALWQFMTEEARTMVDKRRRKEVQVAGDDKQALAKLARSWHVPFLTQAEFEQQNASLDDPNVGVVDDDGHCISRYPPAPSLLNPPDLHINGNSSRRRDIVEGEDSGTGQAGSKPRSVDEEGRICRAAVLGYIVEGGGALGREDDDLSPATHYLLEVESPGETGETWALYKRYSDFRVLWLGLSREFPRIAQFNFPAKESIFRQRGMFTRQGIIEDERRKAFTALLKLLLELNPRPPELIRFLSPSQSLPGSSVENGTVNAARRAAAGTSQLSGNLGPVDPSACVTAQVADGRNRRAQRMRERTRMPDSVTLRLFLVTVSYFQACAVLHGMFGIAIVPAMVLGWAASAYVVVLSVLSKTRLIREFIRRIKGSNSWSAARYVRLSVPRLVPLPSSEDEGRTPGLGLPSGDVVSEEATTESLVPVEGSLKRSRRWLEYVALGELALGFLIFTTFVIRCDGTWLPTCFIGDNSFCRSAIGGLAVAFSACAAFAVPFFLAAHSTAHVAGVLSEETVKHRCSSEDEDGWVTSFATNDATERHAENTLGVPGEKQGIALTGTTSSPHVAQAEMRSAEYVEAVMIAVVSCGGALTVAVGLWMVLQPISLFFMTRFVAVVLGTFNLAVARGFIPLPGWQGNVGGTSDETLRGLDGRTEACGSTPLSGVVAEDVTSATSGSDDEKRPRRGLLHRARKGLSQVKVWIAERANRRQEFQHQKSGESSDTPCSRSTSVAGSLMRTVSDKPATFPHAKLSLETSDPTGGFRRGWGIGTPVLAQTEGAAAGRPHTLLVPRICERPADVLWTLVVFLFVCVTIISERRLARRRRWNMAFWTLAAKVIVGGAALVSWPASLFRVNQLTPAVLLCLLESWRSLAALALMRAWAGRTWWSRLVKGPWDSMDEQLGSSAPTSSHECFDRRFKLQAASGSKTQSVARRSGEITTGKNHHNAGYSSEEEDRPRSRSSLAECGPNNQRHVGHEAESNRSSLRGIGRTRAVGELSVHASTSAGRWSASNDNDLSAHPSKGGTHSSGSYETESERSPRVGWEGRRGGDRKSWRGQEGKE